MKLKIIKLSFYLLLLVPLSLYAADQTLAQRLSGRILLQVESMGEAWYINPADLNRYYLDKPDDAWQIMREFGIGATNNDLNKISIGLANYNSLDSDQDGLPDNLESALGTDYLKIDSDNDGYNDKIEILNNYNPQAAEKMPIDKNFSKINAGKIFLQVENKGEAWYINPLNLKRYFLGRPSDAFTLMRELGLGISNNNLDQINIGSLNNQSQNINNQNTTPRTETSKDAIYLAASAIRQNNKEEVKKYFVKNLHAGLDHTMDFLSADSKLMLGNILSGSKLASETDTERIYTNEVYFSLGGYDVPVKFIEQKQSDGSWKMTNL